MTSVLASLIYSNAPSTLDGQKPWVNINSDNSRDALLGFPPPNARNYTSSEHKVLIRQVNEANSADFTLDRTGFEYHEHLSQEKEFADEAKIHAYYDESIELLKRLTGADRAVIFDHTIRRNRPGQKNDGPENRQPVPSVHVDQTPESAEARVKRHLPESDVPALLSKRYQIINLWRPIRYPAFDWPLALCDFRTLDEREGLIKTTLKYPDRDGETFSVKFSDKHEWWYKRGMTPRDIVLIKCFDSEQSSNIARLTPHTAFLDPSAPADAPLRESIELRALVFYP